MWKPGTPVLWEIPLPKTLHMLVVERHYKGSKHERSLDCVKILVPDKGFYITPAAWLIVIAKGQTKR